MRLKVIVINGNLPGFTAWIYLFLFAFCPKRDCCHPGSLPEKKNLSHADTVSLIGWQVLPVKEYSRFVRRKHLMKVHGHLYWSKSGQFRMIQDDYSGGLPL
jgi:hypothetical protein